jgi:uncharacterized delta-60 repeat protein
MHIQEDRAKSILLNALEIASPEERAAYIEAQCGDDCGLHSEVEELLHHHEGMGDFLESPPVGIGPTIEAAPVTEGPGTLIGSYKLIEQIGEGGMGVVYVAEQKEPVQREVALKIIKPGMDTQEVIARFEAERQALALMDHPNIAKVLDVGTTESGRPYFAMELVNGTPITTYCDANHITPGKRLELFVAVCQAVQHAHQKGIIHRDIKPSNILVAEYDDRAIPKIIDFGVAKAIDQPLTEKTMFTRFGQVVGTVEYMSPEQASLNRLDVDTRSDVYSLGVLFYELLTGETPFDREQLRTAAFDELLRIIREEEPPKPSTRLSTSQSLPSIAANRRIDPKKLRRLVRGDLDWVAMKALEKDRARRYDSASSLGADVQRCLNDEPVEAGPPSAAYRFRKFARRNRTALMTAAVVTVALMVGAVVAGWQAVRATRAMDAEAEQRALAERNATEAEDAASQLRRHLYAAHIRLAYEAWNIGDTAAVLRWLSPYEAADGGEGFPGFEWHYLWRLCHSDRMTLEGHRGDVYFVVFSHDGRTLATASRDHTVKLWDVGTGHVLHTFTGHGGEVSAAAFSPDGRLLATAGEDQLVKLWELDTGEERRTLRGHDGTVFGVAFSPDGAVLASAGKDKVARLWDLETGRVIGSLPGHSDWIEFLAFSPDGKTLATASSDHAVKLWDVSGRRERATLRGHFDTVLSVAFSPDGRLLATGSEDRTVRLWDVASARDLATLRGHKNWVQSVAFSRDGRTLTSAGKDGDVRTWHVRSKQTTRLIRGHVGRVWSVAYSPDGRTLATAGADGKVKLWDLTTRSGRRHLQDCRGDLYSIAFSSDGRTMATAGVDGHARLWDMTTGEESADFPTNTDCCNAVVFSPDGSVLAAAGDTGGVELWSLPSGSRVAELRGHTLPVVGLALSHDGQTLVSLGRDGMSPSEVYSWDVSERRLIEAFPTDGATVNCIEIVQEPPTLAMGNNDGTVGLWDLGTRKPRRTLEEYDRPIERLTSAPEGHFLASANRDGTITIWDLRTGRILKELPAQTSERNAVALSSGGRTVASGSENGVVTLWNVATGQELVSFPEHSGPIASLVFSNDGSTLAAAAEHGDGPAVALWSTRKLPGWKHVPKTDLKQKRKSSAAAVAVQPDGKLIAAGSASDGDDVNFALARYYPDGRLDETFGVGGRTVTDFELGDEGARSLAIQPDGKIVVAGSAYVDGDCDFAVARYHSSGVLDEAFGREGRAIASFDSRDDHVEDMVLQPDGRIVVAGWTDDGSRRNLAMARFQADGTLDPSFGTDGLVRRDVRRDASSHFQQVGLHEDKILASGTVLTVGQASSRKLLLARYLLDGHVDASFGSGGIATMQFVASSYGACFAVQPGGRVLVAGGASSLQYNMDFSVARFEDSGWLDPTFGNGGKVQTDFASSRDGVFAIATQSDGKFILAGRSDLSGTYQFALARYDPDGRLDTSFGREGRVTTDFGPKGSLVIDLVLQSDGKIVAVGPAEGKFGLARYLPDGRMDESFGEGGKLTTSFSTDNPEEKGTLQ